MVGSATGEGVSGLRLISGKPGKRARLWEVPLEKKLDSAAVSPDGRLIAAAVNDYDKIEERYIGGEIVLLDAAGKVVRKITASGGPVFSVNFSADGNELVYKTYFWDEAVKVHNFGSVVRRRPEEGSEEVLFRDDPGQGSGLLSYGPSGLLVVPAGNTEVLKVLDPATGRRAVLNEDSNLEEYRYIISSEGAFSRDGTLFAAHFTSGNMVYIRLFDTATWKLIHTFRLDSLDNGGVAGLSFDPGGEILAAAQGNAFGSKVYVFSLAGIGR